MWFPKKSLDWCLLIFFHLLFFFLFCFVFFFLTAVQFPGEIAEADLPYITALGAGQEVRRQAEVEADQEVTACRSAPTTLAEVTQRAATKVRKKRKRRINEEGARPEEETMKNDHDLGNTTVTTCERKRELTELIVTNGRRREVGRRILVVEVGHGVPLKGSAWNMNMGETRRNGTTGIVIGMAWTTGILGTKDVTMEDTGDSTTKSVTFVFIGLIRWKRQSIVHNTIIKDIMCGYLCLFICSILSIITQTMSIKAFVFCMGLYYSDKINYLSVINLVLSAELII